MLRKTVFPIFFLLCALSQTYAYGANLHIVIEPEFAGKPLVLSKQLYRTGNNDSLFIDAFRCYLSCFRLSANGHFLPTDSTCHLIDAEDPQTLEFVLPNIPAGMYDEINFNIGVDSLSNVSGAMGGDLDPTKGMYWAWNTGFINAKLEGRSEACKTLHHVFEFHIGGFMAPFNTIRQVSLLINNFTVSSNNKTTTIRLRVDLSAWFNNIQLKETNSIVMPSAKAMTMADNYTKMFSIVPVNIQNERE